MGVKEEYYEQIANGLNNIGIDNTVKKDGLVLSQIITSNSVEFEEMTLVAFEEWMEQVLSYNLYLKAQKGSMEAQLVVLESEYSRLMGLETQTVERPRDGGFLSKEEKEASALLQSQQLVDLRDKIVVAKAKLSKIKDIPFGIDKKIDMLKMKYRRRYQLEHGYRDQG